MKTLTLRTFENELTSAMLLITALQYPGTAGYTYKEACERLPLIDKIRAAEQKKTVELEDAEFAKIKSLYEKCPFIAGTAMREVAAVGQDLDAAAESKLAAAKTKSRG